MNKVSRVIELCNYHGFAIVSHGLAPNPNGFCYEMPDPVYWDTPDPSAIVELEYLLLMIACSEKLTKELISTF